MGNKEEIPKKIYLQIGDEVDLSVTSFSQLNHEFITWCSEKCFKNDLEYISKEYSYQQNKELLDKISELENSLEINKKLRHEDTNDFVKALNEYSDKNKELLARVDELEKANVKHVELLKYIRDNPKTWKSGGAGGQDQYAGLPPMLRYIDEIIDQLTSKY